MENWHSILFVEGKKSICIASVERAALTFILRIPWGKAAEFPRNLSNLE